jgi:four helix bundle protein
MEVHSHKNLDIWNKAMVFVTNIYALTVKFSKEEIYGLVSQMRRAAVSIPSNIAEGRAKRRTREFIRFINMANGSTAELETQIIISKNLNYIWDEILEKYLAELNEISRMLQGLYVSLEKRLANAS